LHQSITFVSHTNATAEHTEALNCRPKWVIEHQVQVDKPTMNDNDCTNSDCNDPKWSGKLIQCVVGLFTFCKILTVPYTLVQTIGFAIMYAILTVTSVARGTICKGV
jgi:hypothetical protein